jgi:hypothetical protein
MQPMSEFVTLARRQFFTSSACGIGFAAMASLFKVDGLLASTLSEQPGPLTLRPTHFAPRAKRCICIFLEGGPSQMDLFDPKPELIRLHGQKLPP